MNVKSDMIAFNLGNKASYIHYWPLYTELGILEPKGDCIQHYAFVVGGYTKDPESGTKIPSASVTRYNMHTGETLNLQDLPQPSFWNAALIHPHGCQLWVLGGVVRKGEKYQLSQSVYIYDIKANKWKMGPSLPKPLSQLAACQGSSPFHGIFISGGITQSLDEVCPENSFVERGIYFISKDTDYWHNFSSLETARYGHAMCLKGFGSRDPELYIIGGKSQQGEEVGKMERFSLHRNVCVQYEFWAPLFGNCRNLSTRLLSTIGSNMGFFSDKTDTKSIVHYWHDVKLFQDTKAKIHSRKLPFSVKGALILQCLQVVDSEDPKVVTMKLDPVRYLEEFEQVEYVVEGSTIEDVD